MNIDLSKYYDAQKPTITVFGKAYEVDDDHKKVLGFFQMRQKVKDDEDSFQKILSYVLVDGEKAAEEILSHKMSFSFLSKIVEGVTACMTGQSIEALEAAAKASFRK